MLEIKMLGGFEVTVKGVAVLHWPRRSARHLLQLLAIAPGWKMSRSELLDALSGGDRELGLRGLSDALHALRKALATACDRDTAQRLVSADADAIWLDRQQTQVDVEGFESGIHFAAGSNVPLEDAMNAIRSYRGPLLASESEALHRTMSPVRLQLEQQYVSAAIRLADELEHRHCRTEAMQLLETVSRLANGSEAIHRKLIELYAGLGRFEEAEKQLAICRVALEQESGVRPAEATIDAIRRARDLRIEGQASSKPLQSAATVDPVFFRAPAPLVSLIGRDAELSDLDALLETPERPRLITLCGLGGVGKTQLATNIAHIRRQRYDNGVVFVDLTRAADAAAVPRTVALALGLKRTDQTPWAERVARQLSMLNLLLVLDNFEHVHSCARWVVTVMANAPGVTVICTSRLPLLVSGEHVFDVQPLALAPSAASIGSPADTVASPAAQLFVRYARSRRSNVFNGAQEMAAIERICRSLDGLPLAIELAAARACITGVSTLLADVTAGNVDLENSLRDAPARHKSLTSVLEVTWQMLSAPSQTMLLYAGLFPGDFTLGQLIGAGIHDPRDTERALAELLDTRIVAADSHESAEASSGPGMRFRMLETIRAFVKRRQLDGATQQAALQSRFIEYWRAFCQKVSDSRHTADERLVLDEFEVQFDNISSAIRLAAATDMQLAREMAAAVWFAGVRRSHIFDVIGWIEDLRLLRDVSGETAAEVNLLSAACEVYRAAADYVSARRFGLLAAKNATRPDADGVAAHVAVAFALVIQNETEASLSHALEAVTIAQDKGDERGELEACMLLATIMNRTGQYSRSQRYGKRAIEICGARGIELPIRLIGNVALAARLTGDLRSAIGYYATSATRSRASGEKRAEAIMLLDLAECAILAMQLEQTQSTLMVATEIIKDHKINILECVLHQQLGSLHVMTGHTTEALRELHLSMGRMPKGASMEQADITLLWLLYAHLQADAPEHARETAVRLTSAEVTIRKYLVPSVIAACSPLFARLGDMQLARWSYSQATALRDAEGIAETPAEKLLRARLGPAIEHDQSMVADGLTTTRRPDDALLMCNDFLETLDKANVDRTSRKILH